VDVKGSPLLQTGLLVEVSDRPTLSGPRISPLAEGKVPEAVHLGQDVVEERELLRERTQPILVREEHAEDPVRRRRFGVEKSLVRGDETTPKVDRFRPWTWNLRTHGLSTLATQPAGREAR
jgi:hypothetical protein